MSKVLLLWQVGLIANVKLHFYVFHSFYMTYLFSESIEREQAEDTDFIICITDKLIQNEGDGLGLAKAVCDVTGIPLQRISFWHHARDVSLQEYQMHYRKDYMLHVIDNLL